MKRAGPHFTAQADAARELLHQQGLKITLARQQIVQCLLAHAQMAERVSAEQLFRELRAISFPIGLATVYRVLATLENLGIVRSRQFSAGHKVFELDGSRTHHHILAEDGRTVLEFADAEIENRIQSLAANNGYDCIASELVIYVRPRTRHEEPTSRDVG